MKNSWIMILRYFMAPEDSRPGRIDYWNGVFLAEKTPLNRFCLEASKVFFILTLSVLIMLAFT
ncbi:MAG: hypothetical protein HUK40_23925 [Desulfobacter sp.]|nr:hypothetical protein [Desulfobacter sp.]WDP86803.1 MAG: hypothetical protein HUN05_18125 [Desulfobacter sp.]